MLFAAAAGTALLGTAAPRVATALPRATAATIWGFGWWLFHSLGAANLAIPFERYELAKSEGGDALSLPKWTTEQRANE